MSIMNSINFRHANPENYYQRLETVFPYRNSTDNQPLHTHNWRANMADTSVGDGKFMFKPDTKGYAINLSGSGTYTRGQDGILAFDINRDGQIDKQEIAESNQRLKAFNHNYDLNRDGKVSLGERFTGGQYMMEMRKLDGDGDGRLSASEIAKGGGRVLVDRNQDGQFRPCEQYSPFSVPVPGFGRGSIDYVDPAHAYTRMDKSLGSIAGAAFSKH